GTTARRIYRTAVNGATGSERLLTTISDNTTTTFADTSADTALGGTGLPNVVQPNVATAFTDPTDALRRCPGDLGGSIQRCFLQTPGPSLVYGVRTGAAGNAPDWASALEVVSALPVQIVVLANVPMTTAAVATNGPINLLANH